MSECKTGSELADELERLRAAVPAGFYEPFDVDSGNADLDIFSAWCVNNTEQIIAKLREGETLDARLTEVSCAANDMEDANGLLHAECSAARARERELREVAQRLIHAQIGGDEDAIYGEIIDLKTLLAAHDASGENTKGGEQKW